MVEMTPRTLAGAIATIWMMQVVNTICLVALIISVWVK